MEHETSNKQETANSDLGAVRRSCFNCKNLHSFQGEGDVVCHTYCSERDEIDYTFSNKLNAEKVANNCSLYAKD